MLYKDLISTEYCTKGGNTVQMMHKEELQLLYYLWPLFFIYDTIAISQNVKRLSSSSRRRGQSCGKTEIRLVGL
jgi:hypothetical protein